MTTKHVRALLLSTAVAFTVSASPALAAAPTPPTATTGAATAVTFDSATLAATIGTSGESTEVYFQYGTKTTYGLQTAPTEIAASTKLVAVKIAAVGLTANTVYHYRVVAINATGAKVGVDAAFKTVRIPLSLAITAAPSPVALDGTVVVEGRLSGTGNGSAVVSLQSTPFPYTAAFATIGNPEVTYPDGSFSFTVLSLPIASEFRVVSGTTASPIVPVGVRLAVTLAAHRQGTHRRPTVRFSGTINPVEPNARIAFERLIGTGWKVVGGTVASAAASNGSVTFSHVVRIYRSGFYRALVLPVEGGHSAGYSPTVVIRLR